MVDSWFNPLINTVHLPFSEPLFVGQKTTKNQDFGGAPTRRCSQEPTSQTSMGISMGTGRSKRFFFSRFETTKKTYTLVSHEYSLRVISYIVFFFYVCPKNGKYTPIHPRLLLHWKKCILGYRFFQTNHQFDPANSQRGTNCLPVECLLQDGSPKWSI